jgi:hypothetical protein
MSRLEWVDPVVFEFGPQKKTEVTQVTPAAEPKKQVEAAQETEVAPIEKPKRKASGKKSDKTIK